MADPTPTPQPSGLQASAPTVEGLMELVDEHGAARWATGTCEEWGKTAAAKRHDADAVKRRDAIRQYAERLAAPAVRQAGESHPYEKAASEFAALSEPTRRALVGASIEIAIGSHAKESVAHQPDQWLCFKFNTWDDMLAALDAVKAWDSAGYRAKDAAPSAPLGGGALTDADILRIADALPRHPWGIGSRHSDAVAFARAIERQVLSGLPEQGGEVRTVEGLMKLVVRLSDESYTNGCEAGAIRDSVDRSNETATETAILQYAECLAASPFTPRESAREFCRFPECKCPMDPGPSPDWCARGLPHERGSSPQGEAKDAVRTDTQRIDWLQENRQTVYVCSHTARRPSTMPGQRYEESYAFDGWAVLSDDEPKPTIRAANDAAIQSQDAVRGGGEA